MDGPRVNEIPSSRSLLAMTTPSCRHSAERREAISTPRWHAISPLRGRGANPAPGSAPSDSRSRAGRGGSGGRGRRRSAQDAGAASGIDETAPHRVGELGGADIVRARGDKQKPARRGQLRREPRQLAITAQRRRHVAFRARERRRIGDDDVEPLAGPRPARRPRRTPRRGGTCSARRRRSAAPMRRRAPAPPRSGRCRAPPRRRAPQLLRRTRRHSNTGRAPGRRGPARR